MVFGFLVYDDDDFDRVVSVLEKGKFFSFLVYDGDDALTLHEWIIDLIVLVGCNIDPLLWDENKSTVFVSYSTLICVFYLLHKPLILLSIVLFQTVPTRYVVANPSSFAYLNESRWRDIAGTDGVPTALTVPPAGVWSVHVGLARFSVAFWWSAGTAQIINQKHTAILQFDNGRETRLWDYSSV